MQDVLSDSKGSGLLSRVRHLVPLSAFGALCCVSTDLLACPATPSMMTGWSRTAEADFVDLDSTAFARSRATMLDAASCLDSPPIPADAAGVHRVEALAAFLADDEDATRRSFHAMLEVDPSAGLPAEIALPGHRLSALLQEAQALPASPRAPLVISAPCTLSVDGVPSNTRPADRPALIVVQDAHQHTLWSGLLPPEGTLVLACPDATAANSRRRVWPLWVATGGAVIAAGGLWTATAFANLHLTTDGELIVQDIPEEDLGHGAAEISDLFDRRDRLNAGAVATTGMALGLGALSVGVTIAW